MSVKPFHVERALDKAEMIKRTEEMKLSSIGLLLLLTAAAMIFFADLGPSSDKHAKAGFSASHSRK